MGSIRGALSFGLMLGASVLAVAGENRDTTSWVFEVDRGLAPLLARLGPAEAWQAVAVDPGVNQAAAALPSGGRPGRANVRLVGAGESRHTDLEMPGTVRALEFGPQGRVLYALLCREPKKRDAECHLVSVELDSLKARREMRLPPESFAITRADGGALLVAARNEVRTVLMPGPRSGRLFAVPGDNRSIRSLPGGTRVLVGQAGRLALLDLDDPPGRDAMPIRETLAVRGRVTALAVAGDGTHGRAATEEGERVAFRLDPLRSGDRSAPIASPEPAAPTPEIVAAPPVPQRPETPTPEPEPEVIAAPPAAVAAPPLPQRPETPTPEPEPEVIAAPPAAVAAPPLPQRPETPTPAPEPETRAPVASGDRVRGRISGPAAGEVRAVVILGPGTLLREAARATPRADGSWSLPRLAPGRYRVQLDPGGGKALVTDPPYRTIVVEADAAVRVPEIRVIRVM